MRFVEAPSRARRLVRQGDTLVSTVRTYLRAVWAVSRPAQRLVASTGFAVVSPTQSVDSRFLSWWLQSDDFIEDVVARSVGVSYPAISPSVIGGIKAPVPPLKEQRAIADFLDHETARIDALLGRKGELLLRIGERLDTFLGRILWEDQRTGKPFPTTVLRRLAARIDVGIAEAATHAYQTDGVPLIRSTNVRPNRLDLTELLHIDPAFASKLPSKALRAGDLITVRTGHPGTTALVPASLHGAQTFTQLITTVAKPHSPGFLCLVLNSLRARQYFGSFRWGSAQDNISVPILAAAPVPMVQPEIQEEVEQLAAREIERVASLTQSLSKQLSVLMDRRHALITSAVTGQMDIPSAA